MSNNHTKNKTPLFPLFLLFLLLAGCGTPPVPTASPSPSPVSTPVAEPWQTLSVDELPTVRVVPTQLAGSLPQVSLLGTIEEADISLYGLGKSLGGGILLRQEDALVHFDQSFFPSDLSLAQLPTLWWQDFDGDSQSELAVKYHTGQDETGGCTYDLIFYDLTDKTWTSTAADRDFCADTLLKEIDTSWDERNYVCTLTCGGQQVTVTFPSDIAPGRLVLGHLCLFTEENGQFTAILDAWFPTLSTSAATFRAQVLFDGNTVSLQNIRMDSFAGV